MRPEIPTPPAGTYHPCRDIHSILPYRPRGPLKLPAYTPPAVNIVLRDNRGQLTVRPAYISHGINGEHFLRTFLDFHQSVCPKAILHKILDILLMRRIIITSVKITVVIRFLHCLY